MITLFIILRGSSLVYGYQTVTNPAGLKAQYYFRNAYIPALNVFNGTLSDFSFDRSSEIKKKCAVDVFTLGSARSDTALNRTYKTSCFTLPSFYIRKGNKDV